MSPSAASSIISRARKRSSSPGRTASASAWPRPSPSGRPTSRCRRSIEEALTSRCRAAALPIRRRLAIGDLIRETPALCARDQLKYAKLEQKLADALLARYRRRMKPSGCASACCRRSSSARCASAASAGKNGQHARLSMEAFARESSSELWTVLADFGAVARFPQTNRDQVNAPAVCGGYVLPGVGAGNRSAP